MRDEVGVLDKFGVLPKSIPDWLALVGDTADGIPGLRGWGTKTTATVLRHYEHLDAIPLDEKDWEVNVRGAPRLAAVLRDEIDDAKLYRRLATLVTDAPLTESLDDLAWAGANQGELEELCREIDDLGFLETYGRLRG
jgi:5'-3' exonuclease